MFSTLLLYFKNFVFLNVILWTIYENVRAYTLYLVPRLCPSIAGSSHPPDPSTSVCLSVAFFNHVAPIYCWISSLHLLFGLPLDLFPFLTCHSVHLTVHLISRTNVMKSDLKHSPGFVPFWSQSKVRLAQKYTPLAYNGTNLRLSMIFASLFAQWSKVIYR